MSDKNLTELEWKRFAKGRNLKDAAFVKGLAELERAKEPQAQLTALAEIEKQSDLLHKANKGDKELADYLGDAGKAIDKQRKLSEFEARKSAKDEDDDGPAALGAKMLPLLRQIAKGDDGGALPVMVAVAGKDVAVLVARRTIGASQKKLLTEALGTSAGVKYMSGECLWEGNAHTFVLEAKVSNLAKGIKAALQKQTDARFKVRVRGTDPHDVDEDGEEGGEIENEAQTETNTAPDTAPHDAPEKTQYLTLLRELEPKVTTALRELTGDVPKLKAVFGFAQGKANEGHYAAALQGLEMVTKLLAGPGTVPPAPPLPTPGIKPETQSVEPGVEIKKFTQRVNALMPRIKDGLAALQPGAAGAKLKLSEAAAFTRQQDWPAANALLDQIEQDLEADATMVPRELSKKERETLEFTKKQELEDRWRKVAPDKTRFENELRELIKTSDPRMADALDQQMREMRDARDRGDRRASLEILARVNALTGSAESRQAELKQISMRENPAYKESADEYNASLEPDYLDQLRREAAEEGYGLTADGMTRYALPITTAQWQKGALDPLPVLARLLEQAASKTAEGPGGAEAAIPFIDEIFNVQHPLMRLTERARQYAIDGGFAEKPLVEAAALDITGLFGDFVEAIRPFMLVRADAKDADELLRTIEALAPTLKDFPAPEHAQGGAPSEQLQQAVKALQAGEFSAAGALLMAIRVDIESTRPVGLPGEGFNEQIASRGDDSMRALLQEKLFNTAEELDILAAKKGLPFDTARAKLLILDQAVKALDAAF